MYSQEGTHEVVEQYVDTRSGMHVVRLLRKCDGHEHILQIFVGHSSCPACGGIRHAAGRDIDPKAAVDDVIRELAESHAAMLAYADKHGVKVR